MKHARKPLSVILALILALSFAPQTALAAPPAEGCSSNEGGAHSWLEMTNEPAGCTQEGYIIYFCSECGEDYTETVPALGHD